MEYFDIGISLIAILILISMIVMTILYFKAKYKFNKMSKRKNPEQYKSLHGSIDYEKNFKIGIAFLIFIIIVAIFIGILIGNGATVSPTDETYEKLSIIFLIVFITGLVLILIYRAFKPLHEYKIYKKICYSKYQDSVTIQRNTMTSRVDEKDKFWRKKFRFDISFPTYRCDLTNYEIQHKEYNLWNDSHTSRWVEVSNILEYRFGDFKQFIDLNNPYVQSIINNFCTTRVLNIFYDNNDLIIKQTISFNEDEETITKHINDVEYFYNELIQMINK